jgi:hypothetical protein
MFYSLLLLGPPLGVEQSTAEQSNSRAQQSNSNSTAEQQQYKETPS